ncbi:hypothetical protein ATORI0001_1558 [Lancefieldella rimae ATCC 49626]|uniref:Uncharacterized protein n=1 Tax=Lancefieldella rimae (strain ATCC 49626 / DSM 7090 / CCUG 31168 / NBRC 15546 / VPI D140H-11A) TaxID=553184 RepID=B9CML5_LANR4|nr:hypothetical protein ATORI0001_1558 [Lancefieldella rimae ATCC 49626]
MRQVGLELTKLAANVAKLTILAVSFGECSHTCCKCGKCEYSKRKYGKRREPQQLPGVDKNFEKGSW